MSAVTQTADIALIRAIERHCALAWPAPELVRVNGWDIRFADGLASRRVNSLTPMEPVAGRFSTTLDLARRLCFERQLRCHVRLNPLAQGDERETLGALGAVGSDETIVKIAPLGRGAFSGQSGSVQSRTFEVVIEPHATPHWLEANAIAHDDGDTARNLTAQILASVRMKQAYAMILEGGRVVAIGRAATENGLTGIFQISTLPEARRRGFARQIVTSLMAWGRTAGAMRAYLQVEARNTPAQALYDGLGFFDLYHYDYWTVPDSKTDATIASQKR